MSSGSSKTQKVEESAQESFRALIHAIAPETRNAEGKVTVDKLAQRLTELLGPDATENYGHTRNERGELVNEEGLPVVEITEPINDDDPNYGKSMPPPVSVEPLLPIYQLPSETQEKLRAQRNRIFELLEQEEAEAEEAARNAALRESEELSRKRAEEASKDRDRKKANRELQKKMGRALIQNLNEAKAKEEGEREAQRLRDKEVSTEAKSPSVKKKTVSFVDSVEEAKKDTVKSTNAHDWGDVIPARLQPSKRPPSILDRQPMKMQVVERTPGRPPPTSTPNLSARLTGERIPDSDDESEGDEDEQSSADETTESEEGEEELDEEEIDLDFAARQREIALEYHKKRNIIGQAAAASMMAQTDPTGDAPALLSQYRASRVAAAYNASLPSSSSASSARSFGDTVVPAGVARTVQRAVRVGKLDDDDRLVGGEDDSASEVEEGVQEVIELLRKGEVYNIGPDGEYLHFVPPTATPPSTTLTGASVVTPEPDAKGSPSSASPSSSHPPPSMRTKPTSKFKVSRAAAGRPSALSTADSTAPATPSSLSSTPVSNAPRSSPKTASPIQDPTKPMVLERKAPTTRASNNTSTPGPRPTFQPSTPIHTAQTPQSTTPSPLVAPTSTTMPPMVVDSPSFPNIGPMGNTPTSNLGPSSFPMIVDSPSFPSMIVESPSFPQPHGAPPQPVVNPRSSRMPPTVMPTSTRESRRPDRPPQVMASSVVESKRAKSQSSISTVQHVSRFKAERS